MTTESLEDQRAELLRRHTEARRRRDRAPLESAEYRDAAIEIADLEVRINGVDVVAAGGLAAEPAKGAVIETSHH